MVLLEDFLCPVHTNPSTNMEGGGINLLTTFSKVWLAFSRFSRNAGLLNNLLVQKSSTDIHENQTNLFVSEPQ
jgi:hypothetical protein